VSNTGADPIAEIITRLVAIQEALTPPLNAPKAVHALDALTADPQTFPAFVNVPRRGTRTISASGVRSFRWTIDMILLFARGDIGYASVAQRAWVPVVLNAFDVALKLGDNSVQGASITEVDFDPLEINDVPFTAITFTLIATTTEGFTFGA